MMEESGIFVGSPDEIIRVSGNTPLLVRAGSLFSCFRLELDGKYFFFKTNTEDNEVARQILKKEFELSASCDNPHIARALFFGEFIEGKKGILMEYVEGRSLVEFLAERPSQSTRKRIFSELLEALNCLHQKGIVHNDLKPGNILITSNGDRLKLIDFGLSDDDTHFLLKRVGCTDSYAAPELKERRCSDARSDIYSVGKLMSALFGRRFARIRRKCLKENPAKRFADIGRLKLAWKRRNLPRVIVGTGACIFLVGLGIFWFMVSENEHRVRLDTMERALTDQKIANQVQLEQIRSMQESYDEVKEEYQNVKSAYDYMTDSLEVHRATVEAHEEVRDKILGDFKKALEAKMSECYDSLKLCMTWREMNRFRQEYNTYVEEFYASYPKTADGEDITVSLSALLQANLIESRELFNTLIPQIRK